MNSLFRTTGRKTVGGAALLALVLGVSNLPAQTSSDSSVQSGWKARGSHAAPKFQESVKYQDSPKFQEAPTSQAAPKNQEAPVQAEVRRTSAEEAFDDAPAASQTAPKLFEAPTNQIPVVQPPAPQTPPWQRPAQRRPAPSGRQVRYQPGFNRDGPMQPMNMRMQPAPEAIPPGTRSRMQQGPSYSGPQYKGPQSGGPQYTDPQTSGPTYMPDGYTPGDGSWIDGPQDGSGDPMDGGSCSSCAGGGPACCGGPCDPYYEYGRPGLLDGLVGSIFHHPGWCRNTDGCYKPYGWWRPWTVFDESSVFLGTTSFKGPVDTGGGQSGPNGNFGFQEGFNVAGALLDWCGIGYQVGANYAQSNFHGDFVLTVRPDSRDQQFYTAGLFHRAWYGQGVQFGVVGDWLRDHYYVKYNLALVRMEISYLTGGGHEFGYWGTANNSQVTVTANNAPLRQTLEPTNIYAFFYRYTLLNGSQGRFWAGGAGTKQGVVGADFRVPITNRWDLNGRFNYIIPNQPAGRLGLQDEGWGMSMNLVWYPGRAANGIHNGPYRPLFNVADNTTFFVRRPH